jgi:cytochrome c553
LRRYVLPRFAALAALTLGNGAHGTASASDAKLLSYGRHLSGECSACHRIDGVDNGIPSITGWDPDEFVETLIFYRNGERPNQAMVSVAQSLDDAQYKALAAYYGSLPKPPKAAKKK